MGYQTQVTLQDQLEVAGLAHHIQSAGQPIHRMLFPMLPQDVAVGLELGRVFGFVASFDVSPGQEHDEHISVDRQVRTHPKVGQAQLGLEIEIDDFNELITNDKFWDGSLIL